VLGLLMGVRMRDLLRALMLPPELREQIARDAGYETAPDDDADEDAELEELDPLPFGVIRGRVALSKDGRPMDLYALAEGVTGELSWVAEHFQVVERTGQLLPRYSGPSGWGGHIDKAETLHPDVTSANKLRAAWSRLLQLPPLGLTPEQIRAFAFTGHAIHGTLADLARFIGNQPHPRVPGLLGFGYDDTRELGHWQRDQNEPVNAADAARAAAAEGRDAPPPGATTMRGAQPLRYSSGANRKGERARQIEVRARAINWMRAALRSVHGGWRSLIGVVRETGSDWEVLFPERAMLAAMPRMVPAP
jgi:hypothetical protein